MTSNIGDKRSFVLFLNTKLISISSLKTVTLHTNHIKKSKYEKKTRSKAKERIEEKDAEEVS